MRTLGIIILIIGIILGIYALSMDTSVQVNYSGNSYGMPDRVNNLGLMSARQNNLLIAGILSIIGTMILIFKRPDKKDNYQFTDTLGKAKSAETHGNYKESLDMYKETLYHLRNDYKNLDKKSEEGRQRHIRNVTEKIETLENQISGEDELPQEKKDVVPINESPLEILKKMKASGLISESEYEEKHKNIISMIEQKEKTDDVSTYTEIINNRTNKKAQPLIELAIKAKEGGVISEEEYEAKKKEIIDRCFNEVKMQDLSLNKDSYNRLSQPKKDRVEMYLETISPSELIVLHHNKIKVIDNQRWQEIIKESVAANFEVIYQSK
jgi:hypothetical protein